ncbi:MAG: hypothetical protein ACJA09_003542 [Alcanivorax sp.]|jgi:hypothetical protein
MKKDSNEVLGFGFWVLGFGFWVLDFGFWILDENLKRNGVSGVSRRL